MSARNSFISRLSDIAQGWREVSVSCQLTSPPSLLSSEVGINGTKLGRVQSVFRAINRFLRVQLDTEACRDRADSFIELA